MIHQLPPKITVQACHKLLVLLIRRFNIRPGILGQRFKLRNILKNWSSSLLELYKLLEQNRLLSCRNELSFKSDLELLPSNLFLWSSDGNRIPPIRSSPLKLSRCQLPLSCILNSQITEDPSTSIHPPLDLNS